MITIEVDAVGWQDDEGVEFFAPSQTPYGPLENIRTHEDDGELVIDDAGTVVLVSKNLLYKFANGESNGITFSPTAYGFQLMTVDARNGWVKYRVYPDDVEWSDRPGEKVNCFIAVKDSEEWIPEGPKPSYKRREIKEVPVKGV